MGPFPYALGKVDYMVVAADYFTKWIEVEPLACISGRQMIKFIWKNVVTRFGIPKILISDNGLQFAENQSLVNGQVEVSNRRLVNEIKKRLGKSTGNWVEQLPNMHWSYRTMPRVGSKETPF